MKKSRSKVVSEMVSRLAYDNLEVRSLAVDKTEDGRLRVSVVAELVEDEDEDK